MANSDLGLWLDGVSETVNSYRKMIDATVAQLTDEELHKRPAAGFNSVASILRHLGGNLQSRWTDFLETDGEKPARNRDTEFDDWAGDRDSLLKYFNAGWEKLTSAIRGITESNVNEPLFIRGERHTVPQAIIRSLTHLSYHVGQICMIARMVHEGEWKWLTIAPGKSAQHNESTWGTAASRSVGGSEE
ncbi:MAG: DUF1572 family protein [Planctomycetales bacterium]|nr:DUF1572 family protein [Planctomycetales bacterium]